MKLYFVRHGQTYLNKYKKMQGWSDAPLTLEGEEAALETGIRLSDIPFVAVYTSDLGRTQQTAKLILSQSKYPKDFYPMQEFRESCFGFFEGEEDKTFYSKVAEKHGISLRDVFLKLDMETISSDMLEMDPYKDAELTSDVLERVLKGIQTIIDNHNIEDSILIVTHGNIIRTIVKHFSSETQVMTEIKNSSISIIDYVDGQYQLETFNS